MSARSSPQLFSRRFRCNPVFRLVAIGDLTPAESSQLGGVRGDGEMTAVLLSTTTTLSAKAVCANTVRLLEGLQTPSTLPAELISLLASESDLLLRLVLDSVLEIEHEGRFLSGAAAAGLLHLEKPGLAEDCTVSRISQEALHYAEELAIDNAPELSARLYFYNRIPISPAWTRRLGTTPLLDAWLGLDAGTALRTRLDHAWIDTPPAPENPSWRHFRSRRHYAGGSPFKLYVNPRAELFPEALAEVVPVFEEHGIAAFKVSRDLQGVLRPDKLVAYSPTREQMEGAASVLACRLRGIPAQVVPFTAPLDGEGLLSWGMDPPRSEQVSTWQGISWRRWITDRLAVTLIAARGAGAPSPSQFALQRLALEGIDVRSWTPASVEWARRSSA